MYNDDRSAWECCLDALCRAEARDTEREKDEAPKKIPETDAIFKQLLKVNQKAEANPKTLRISVDAKATVKLGWFDRGGQTRVPTIAGDHDFATKTVTL